ncbi:MAG: hypothetical protein ACXVKA_08615 [Acidimicrobiia bacterium]
MNLTFWIVFAFGVWAVGMGTLYVCAAIVKEVDENQSDVLGQGRRARLTAPQPGRRAG